MNFETPITKISGFVDSVSGWNVPAGATGFESISDSYNPSISYNDGLTLGEEGKKVGAYKKLSLCDPICQICERIEAFFRGCKGVTVVYQIYNNHGLGWKKDENGQYIVGTKTVVEDGEARQMSVFYSEDHVTELRIYTQDLPLAGSLSNVIRHVHVVNEEFEMASPIDNKTTVIGQRKHLLYVRVMIINDVDPMVEGTTAPSSVIQECYGTYPLNWNDMENYGEEERCAPGGPDNPDYPDYIPHGWPDEYEQYLWETGFNGTDMNGNPISVSPEAACAWKWKWLKQALAGNPNIANTSFEFNDGMNTWRFIECSRIPVVFNEDNLTSARGFNSILAADLLPQIFAIFGRFNVATYARQHMIE